MKISVIVPVYNVSDYIEKSLESLEKQTIFDELKIILIDDCSTDSSYDACKNFKVKYPQNVILLKNEVNRGVSYTRNRALEYVDTDYVIFFDADDVVSEDIYERLLNTAILESAEMVTCNIFYVEGDKVKNRIKKVYRTLNQSEALRSFHALEFINYNTVNKLFRYAAIKNVKFNENLKIAEDMLFVYNCLLNINKVVVDFSDWGYYYVKRSSSTMNSKINLYYNDHFKVLDIMKNNEKDTYLKNFLIFKMVYDKAIYINMLSKNKSDYTVLLKKYRQELMTINKKILLKNINLKRFLMMTSVFISPRISIFFIGVIKRLEKQSATLLSIILDILRVWK